MRSLAEQLAEYVARANATKHIIQLALRDGRTVSVKVTINPGVQK